MFSLANSFGWARKGNASPNWIAFKNVIHCIANTQVCVGSRPPEWQTAVKTRANTPCAAPEKRGSVHTVCWITRASYDFLMDIQLFFFLVVKILYFIMHTSFYYYICYVTIILWMGKWSYVSSRLLHFLSPLIPWVADRWLFSWLLWLLLP